MFMEILFIIAIAWKQLKICPSIMEYKQPAVGKSYNEIFE